MNYTVEITRPFWLIGLALLSVLLWCHLRSLSDFPLWQRRLSLVVRSLMVILLVLALAGLAIRTPTRQRMMIVAIDSSESLGEEANDRADEVIEQLRAEASGVQLGFVRFAQTPSTPVEDPRSWKEPLAREQCQATDLASAIRVSAASIAPNRVPDVLLLTDGNETEGDGLAAAARVTCPINVITLPTRDDLEVQLSDVIVPAQVRQGEPFYVEIVVQSNHETEATIDLFRNDLRVEGSEGKTTHTLEEGENRFRIRQVIDDKRQVDFSARISAQKDTLLDNNSAIPLVGSFTPQVNLPCC